MFCTFRLISTWVALGLLSGLVGSFIVFAQRPPETPIQPDQDFKSITAPQTSRTLRANRIREGTAFKDMRVFFLQTGDRTVLYTVGENQRFACLENLALERVLTSMQEKPEQRRYWKIEGVFTEFKGDNFVLIRRAVVDLSPTASSPTPNVPASNTPAPSTPATP